MFRILHFSDYHVWRARGMDGDWAIKRVLGRLNLWLRRARQYPPEWGHKVLEAILASEADFVVFSGDATSAALRSEFEEARRLFAPLRARWGDRFIAIPGNHDRYTRRATRAALFEQFLSDAGAPALPYARTLVPGAIGLAALDVSVYRPLTSRGRVTPAQIEHFAALIRAQREITPFVIALGHYPLAYPPGIPAKWQHALPRREQLLAAIAGAGASLYLHGHKHNRWVLRPVAGSPLTCVNPGSAGLKSDDPARAAGFVTIRIHPPQIVSIQASVIVSGPRSLMIESRPL